MHPTVTAIVRMCVWSFCAVGIVMELASAIFSERATVLTVLHIVTLVGLAECVDRFLGALSSFIANNSRRD